jgi:hypothetical protein
MSLNGISITAMIVLASFAIDRAKAGILFLLSSEHWEKIFPDPSLFKDDDRGRAKAQRKRKLLEFGVAGTLVIAALVAFPKARVLLAMGRTPSDMIDAAFTWLILTAGSDRLGDLLKGTSGESSHASTPPPITITGELRVVDNNEGHAHAEAFKRSA